MADQISEQEKATSSQWDHARFVGKIIWATKHHPFVSSDLPKRIDLTGKIGEISDDLLSKTLADPKKRERGKVAKVDFEGKLRISKEESVGEETHVQNSVRLGVKKGLLNPQYSEQEYPAFDMHTHGSIDVPPSPQDFSALLMPVEEGGSQAAIIITPSSRLLIIKTLDTPDFTTKEAEEFVRKSTAQIQHYYEHMKKFSPSNDLYMKSTIQRNMQFVLDTCRDYKLKLYTSTGGNVYSEAS